MENKLISPKEASRILGVTPTTLANWDRAGKLKPILTVGGHRRYKLNEIMKMREAK